MWYIRGMGVLLFSTWSSLLPESRSHSAALRRWESFMFWSSMNATGCSGHSDLSYPISPKRLQTRGLNVPVIPDDLPDPNQTPEPNVLGPVIGAYQSCYRFTTKLWLALPQVLSVCITSSETTLFISSIIM
jgi:hypothetical protein